MHPYLYVYLYIHNGMYFRMFISNITLCLSFINIVIHILLLLFNMKAKILKFDIEILLK